MNPIVDNRGDKLSAPDYQLTKHPLADYLTGAHFN